MTFLNALFLIALPLVAIPVLLHFVRRRDKKVIPWGAMRFLQAAETESRRMKLPESLLLMLLRCAMVAGLIFALARPLISWGGASSNERELIVIVDDSLSTDRRIDGEPVFESIKSSAREVIELSGNDAQFRILLAAAGGRWIGENAQSVGSKSGQDMLETLAQAKPMAADADLFACAQLALALGDNKESSGIPAAKHVVIVTDGTNPGWQTAGEGQLAAMEASIRDRGVAAKIQVLEVDAKPDANYANLSIMRLQPLQERVGVDEKIRLAGQVTNTGNVASRPSEVTWYMGAGNTSGRPKGTSVVPALDPGQSAEISFTTRIKKPGAVAFNAKLQTKFQTGGANNDDDDLPLDSVASAVVEVVKEVPVLMIDNTLASANASPDRLPQEIVLLSSALGYHSERDGEKPNADYHSVFAPTVMTGDDALTEDLSPYHAIFVRGADNQTAELADRLLPEIHRGCGVWITLDAETNPDDFNQNWYQDGAGISPLPLVDNNVSLQQNDDAPDEEESSSEDLRIHPPSTLHPATRTLGDLQRVDLDEVTIQRHAWFEPLLLGDEVPVLLRSNRGQPLAIENAIGKGRVIVQSFPLSLDATTWPVTSSFVVLVHDWLDYLTSPSAVTLNLNSGNPITWRYSDAGSKPAWLTLPDGTEIDLSQSPESFGIQGSSGTFRFFVNQLPGTYTVQTSALVENPRTIPFHVGRSPAESEAVLLEELDRTRLVEIGKIEWNDNARQLVQNAVGFESEFSGSNANRRSAASGGVQPIWQTLITAMIAMVLVELLLAGRIGSRRGRRTETKVQHPMEQQPKSPKRKKSVLQRA